MGIEVWVIIGILVVAGGIGIYFFTRPNQNDNGIDAPFSIPGSGLSTTEESEKRSKRDNAAPPAQQSQGSAPPDMKPDVDDDGLVDEFNWRIGDDVDEFDDFMEEAEEEPAPTEIMFGDVDLDDEAEEDIPQLNPAIDDTQTMKAVTREDTQEMKELVEKAPRELLPDEIKDWMDDLATEKERIEGGLGADLEEETGEAVLDTEYPKQSSQAPPQPSNKPVGESTSDDAPSATTAHFSAFYPREAEAGKRYGVYIYAHAESMLEQITNDAAKFKEELGGNIPQPRTARDSKALAHGTRITVSLESEEVEFEPDMLTKRWHGDWTRYEFEFRPKAELIDETIFVRASIMVLGFEIAKIKFAMEVIPPQMQVMSRMADSGEEPTNPFAKAKLESKMAIKYEKIFISYSRKDKLIAEAFKVIQEAAGNDVFFDVDDIRTGEDWQAAIARAIDEADYLQLFWSEHSAESEWCGYEWDYALTYRCKENKCREFIRPVWWTAPMPPPPDSLNHLNFRRFDFEKLMKRD